MGYLQDFCYYNSGNECPEVFWIWSGLSLLGHIIGRKVWFMHGRFPIYPSLYVGLFGSPGSGKSTAKDEVKSIITKTPDFAHMLVSSNLQSREDIIDLMIEEDCARTWVNPLNGQVDDFRPFYIIANEFESFLSVNPAGMVEFLVDVFDTNAYSKGFKKDRIPGKKHSLQNPFVSLLSCGIPEWLMRELKVSMFSGGLGRRLLIVVAEPTKLYPRPEYPPQWDAVKARVIDHLKEVYYVSGPIKETPKAMKWWMEWYMKERPNKPTDPILAQFHSTEHVYLLKVASLLAMNERPFKMLITDEHYEVAWAMLGALKPRIKELTTGVGRNSIAGFSAQLLEMLRTLGGATSARRLKLYTYRDAPGGFKGYEEAIKYLMETKQIFKTVPDTSNILDKYEEFMFLPLAWEAYQKNPLETLKRIIGSGNQGNF